jgi:hypothetical protein
MAGYATLIRLLNSRRLRAVGLALRADPTADVRDRATDSTLVGVAERLVDGVDDAFDHLRTLERRLREASDRRAVFLTIYTRMTAAGYVYVGNMDQYCPRESLARFRPNILRV